ncbi:unnamed protein product [Adineta ricciae]|uniref:IRS-type PTB domain-containing protein n=1 Tax=Adineta ricciae TaxID=249248 RepID=A0A814KBT7_ADIRI|nr:unnamed protein product [Adineta ricciae]
MLSDNSQPTYSTPASTTINDGNETKLLLTPIKLRCIQRKQKSKRHIYLTFVDNCSISTANEQPCIEIIGKTNSTPILLSECISCEFFDTIKNDFEAFIYIYYELFTVSIYFSDEHISKKAFITKYLESIHQKKPDSTSEQIPGPELSYQSTTEHIIHTFDIKLIPYDPIITRDHVLIGHARLYFTTTDLYITSADCNRTDLKKTIVNQCPSRDQTVLCIPYFTIKHYGNRSNIFLIELGKSTYGNGEVHMKCRSSSLASTIHLLVSPVIEERPLILSSAFQNQLLTNKRIEKLKRIHPPVQLTQEIANLAMGIPRKDSVEPITEENKPRSVSGFFRKLIKSTTSFRRSQTFNSSQNQLEESAIPLSTFLSTRCPDFQLEHDPQETIGNPLIPLQSQSVMNRFQSANNTNHEVCLSMDKQEMSEGTYLEMGPPSQRVNENQEVEKQVRNDETTVKVDIGVNTIISIPPSVHSAIIVGTTIHLIAEDRIGFPIGQRSFTSPASVMQPFKAQLSEQAMLNSSANSTNMIACISNSSSSFHHPTSTNNSQQSLLLSYGIVTFNKTSVPNNDTECDSTIDRRLNSDLSLLSTNNQQQPSNIYSFDSILSTSSSSSSHIFRTLGENVSAHIPTSTGGIILLDENLHDQTTNYLLGPALPLFINEETPLSRLSSISRSHLSHIIEENITLNDSYTSLEHISSLPTTPHKSSLPGEKLTGFINMTSPSNPSDHQYDELEKDNDASEENTEQSQSKLYTNIDFHQVQRRDPVVKMKIDEQSAPFVL